MEGKSMLFKYFADIDSVPIVLDVHSADEIVAAVKAIAPTFGGINLEDIAAPLCFEVEERLAEELPIPVMHDDQHGTATVTLAGLINACKVTGRELKDCKIVVVGAGAAGVAIAKLLHKYAQPHMVAVDSTGIISRDRDNLTDAKLRLLEFTNPDNVGGALEDALESADVFIGVSQPNLLNADLIARMAKDPIVFAMANPDPEILPDEAKTAGVAVMATGRSDFPNQINNALVFPGIFRGALDNRVRQITDEHKIKAAEIVASFVANPTADQIVPKITAEGLAAAIATEIV
jgi:malate dehydrogenase (oxaloacetate-decarboxylating)